MSEKASGTPWDQNKYFSLRDPDDQCPKMTDILSASDSDRFSVMSVFVVDGFQISPEPSLIGGDGVTHDNNYNHNNIDPEDTVPGHFRLETCLPEIRNHHHDEAFEGMSFAV